MRGVGDVERHETMERGYRLQPVVARDERDAAILSLECVHERDGRRCGCNAAQQVETTVERVDVDALSVRKQARLARVIVLVAARTRREGDRAQQSQILQSPHL